MIHQWRDVGDEPVKYQSCEESSQDTFHTNKLLALNVINDDNNSDNLRIRSKHYQEKAEMTATEENVPLKKVTRYDLNIASGIIHSVKEIVFQFGVTYD